MPTDYPEITRKRVGDHICARCRKPFQQGHRVVWAFIILDPQAYNPERVTERGLELGKDLEFCHADCSDPFLDGKNADKLR